MSYKNKTYVAFASEDIKSYWLMEAWKANEKIDFNFYDAHDLFIARDTSSRETIKNRLRQRMKNAKQVVLLMSPNAMKKGDDGKSFLSYEIDIIIEFDLPIVIANLNQRRDSYLTLNKLENHYSISTSFQPAIIKYALDHYCNNYQKFKNQKNSVHIYKKTVYDDLNI